MKDALALFVDVVATHRLVRLATRDVISEPVRAGVVRWSFRRAGIDLHQEAGEPIAEAVAHHEADAGVVPALATLATCPWCCSVHAAALVVAARRLAPRWWEPVGTALALSSLAVLTGGLEDA